MSGRKASPVAVLSVLVALCAAALFYFSAPAPKGGGVTADGASDKAGLDFVAMNATMRITQFYRLFEAPREFEGKTVRVRGRYLADKIPATGKMRYACMVTDEAGCCGIGDIVLRPKDGEDWSAGGPKADALATFAGRLEIVDEGDAESHDYLPCIVDAVYER